MKLFAIVCSLIAFIVLDAYSLEDKFDSQGRDFWITFMPNQHNNISSTSAALKYGDSLYIFVAANKQTSGSITYFDRSGGVHTSAINISDPNSMFIFKVSFYDYELWGANTDSDHYPNNYQQESVSKMSFHVVTDNDVSVYAHSQAEMTSDAFLVLPTDVLGKDYFVASYYSEVNNYGDSQYNAYNTPSQFAIVASEDNTSVSITPSCPTAKNGNKVQNIVLQKGETYLVQAKIDMANVARYDLTGTKVHSDKPVALFSGHERATVPAGINASRDFLAEQMLPVLYWGNNAFLTPMPLPNDEQGDNNDYYRVIVAYDSTLVNIGGTEKLVLKAGQFISSQLVQPAVVKANKPIMTAVYKKSSGVSTQAKYNGDPFMMILPPKEQYMNSYRVINIQSMQLDANSRPFKVYNEQYICVTIPDSAKASLKVNGVAPIGNFIRIPNSEFSYINIKTQDGVKSVTADVPFGIFVLGYGLANSYGYTGGMSFVPQDIFAPSFDYNQDCYKATGYIAETRMNDGGISSYGLDKGSIVNANVSVSNDFNSKQIPFTAELIDTRQDGSFILSASDSARNSARDTVTLFGFTVCAQNSDAYSIPAVNFPVLTGRNYEFDYPIKNYGKGVQTIVTARFANSTECQVLTQMPVVVQPGTSSNLRLRLFSTNDKNIRDTLILGNGCSDIALASLNVEFITDRTAPDTSSALNQCRTIKTLFVTDTGDINIGIKAINVVSENNCTVAVSVIDPRNWTASVTVNDANYDAIYELFIVDSANNSRTVRDTVQGFTLSIGFAESDKNFYNLGELPIGLQRCDSIMLKNYGLKPLFVDRFSFVNNVYFSIPQQELPVIVPPGRSLAIPYCYYSLSSTGFSDYDSIFVSGNCLTKNLKFMATSIGTKTISQDDCGNDISLEAKNSKFAFSLSDVFPNPASGEYFVQFGIAKQSIVKLQIIDLGGTVVSTLINESLASGIYRRSFTTNGLPAGIYMLRLSSGTTSATTMLSVTN